MFDLSVNFYLFHLNFTISSLQTIMAEIMVSMAVTDKEEEVVEVFVNQNTQKSNQKKNPSLKIFMILIFFTSCPVEIFFRIY